VNIFVVFALSAKVHPLMSWKKLDLPANRSRASATSDTSQSGMSEHPTAPHRLIAGSGSQHSLSEEQHLSPDGTASRHASTVALSSAPSVNCHSHVASCVSDRSVHDVTPFSTYPAWHVGTQDVPLTRVSVQLPTPPSCGGVDASHAFSLRTHADGGPAFAPLELVYVFPALVKSLHAAWELSAPQLVYLSFQAAALLNICPKTVTPSAKFHMVMSSSKTLL
jgi:hypothetical protein